MTGPAVQGDPLRRHQTVHTGRLRPGVNPLGVPLPPALPAPAPFRPGGVFMGPSPERPQVWECAGRNCTAAARTVDAKVPYHKCADFGGAIVPLVKVGTKATHRLIERPDDVRTDLVQPVEDKRGRLVMAVETHTDEGYSTTVYAPTATADHDDIDAAKETARGDG